MSITHQSSIINHSTTNQRQSDYQWRLHPTTNQSIHPTCTQPPNYQLLLLHQSTNHLHLLDPTTKHPTTNHQSISTAITQIRWTINHNHHHHPPIQPPNVTDSFIYQQPPNPPTAPIHQYQSLIHQYAHQIHLSTNHAPINHPTQIHHHHQSPNHQSPNIINCLHPQRPPRSDDDDDQIHHPPLSTRSNHPSISNDSPITATTNQTTIIRSNYRHPIVTHQIHLSINLTHQFNVHPTTNYQSHQSHPSITYCCTSILGVGAGTSGKEGASGISAAWDHDG